MNVKKNVKFKTLSVRGSKLKCLPDDKFKENNVYFLVNKCFVFFYPKVDISLTHQTQEEDVMFSL